MDLPLEVGIEGAITSDSKEIPVSTEFYPAEAQAAEFRHGYGTNIMPRNAYGTTAARYQV
jgi:hypothetical protein